MAAAVDRDRTKNEKKNGNEAWWRKGPPIKAVEFFWHSRGISKTRGESSLGGPEERSGGEGEKRACRNDFSMWVRKSQHSPVWSSVRSPARKNCQKRRTDKGNEV